MCDMKQTVLRKRYIVYFFILFLLFPVRLCGQLTEKMYQVGDYRLQPEDAGRLSLAIDNLSFFHDNEFKGPSTKGYTLPGLWLQSKLKYQPLENVRLELGLHSLVYHGVSKYPNYAYRDIATWKGEHFQRGLHVLPYFRAQVQLKSLSIILGNLYGGSRYQMIEPLYSPELNLTADPEMGAQIIYDVPRFLFDIWINWESFIFRQDVHREVFTVGISSKIKYNTEDSDLHFYTPVQLLFQHRGGELDIITYNSISTQLNAAAGLGLTWNANNRLLKRLNVEADVMGYSQQSGTLSPINHGYAFYAQTEALWGKHASTRVGYFWGDDFVSLFGNPYFGTISTRYAGATLDTMRTIFFSADYSYEFGHMFAVGGQVNLYYASPGELTFPDGGTRGKEQTFNCSFGVYFRANMDFLLKRL